MFLSLLDKLSGGQNFILIFESVELEIFYFETQYACTCVFASMVAMYAIGCDMFNIENDKHLTYPSNSHQNLCISY